METDNSILNGLKETTNFKLTENGATAHYTTLNAVYDMFAFGGAYRNRTDADCILLFKNAIEQDKELALKCLFYLRDVRGGQGERRFFRVCLKWLANEYPYLVTNNIDLIAEYGRWDDMFVLLDTPVEEVMLKFMKNQLRIDMDSKTPCLLGKWMPSENASSRKTKRTADKLRKYLKMTHKQYRIMLSDLRRKINIVERLMSANKWDKIEFDKIPSKAGLIYKNAFARRDIIKAKYENFIKSEKTTVNAKTLYPYEVVAKALEVCGSRYWYNENETDFDNVDRIAVEKYWNNLPNYFADDAGENPMLCVVDTSGSMTCGSGASKPINVAIGLGIYAAERMNGAFKNHYISFASRPQLIKVEGVDFVDKVERIYRTNLIDNTNLEAVFKLLKDMVTTGKAKAEDLPSTICVISDMEIDDGTSGWSSHNQVWTEKNAATFMENIRKEWAAAGLKMPKLTYWNVDARNNTILDLGPNVSYVSGCSPVIFEQVTKGITGVELMLNKLRKQKI